MRRDNGILARADRAYLDLAIEHLALDEAALRARVADVEGERDAYRELAQVALGQVAKMTVLVRRLRAEVVGLREAARASARSRTEQAA